MSYSYTEKKRIRKNFGTFAKVMDLPNLVETQINSYSDFLQAEEDYVYRNRVRPKRLEFCHTTPAKINFNFHEIFISFV